MQNFGQTDAIHAIDGSSYRGNISAVYASVVFSCCMLLATFYAGQEQFTWSNLFPLIMGIFAAARGLQWRFNPNIVFNAREFRHRAVCSNVIPAIWAVYHAFFEECSQTELIMIFSFIAFTHLALCTALVLVPSSMNIVLAIGITCGVLMSIGSDGLVPMAAVLMYAGTGVMLRMLMLQHRASIIDAHQAHASVLSALDELSHEKQQVLKLAYSDALTGLNNRRSFIESLTKSIALDTPSEPTAGMQVLLLFDLNGFKKINDNGGHAAGDAALIEVAARLNKCLRKGELSARLGGDEFAVLFHVDGLSALKHRRIEFGAALHGKLPFASREITISAACGYTIIQRGLDTTPDVLKRADYASYKAKSLDSAGEGHLYSSEDEAMQRAHINKRLSVNGLVQNGTIQSVFQPIVYTGVNTVETFGYEVLSRWPEIGGGFVSPPDALKIVDELGKTVAATKNLLDGSIKQRRMLPVTAPLFFNLSSGQFRNEKIWSKLPQWLTSASLDPYVSDLC